MKSTHYVSMLLALSLFVIVSATANAITPTKILDNGPDGQKLVFVVVGDGYSGSLTDQAKYAADVDSLVLHGVLTHDFYRDNKRAFNVYRLDLVSNVSGVGGPDAAADTALQTIYSGDWNRCWIEESAKTNTLLNSYLGVIPKYDYVMILQNESRYGGCRRGSRLYVTSGAGWEVVAHEYGHGIGGLFDEYSAASNVKYMGKEYGPIVNTRNCTTVLNTSNVSWSSLITNPNLIVPLPTTFDVAHMDPNFTVGLFEGCATYKKGIYRPVSNCRMNTNSPQFCPVCRAIMNKSVERFLGNSPVSSAGMPAELKSLLLSNHAYSAQDNPQTTGTYLHIVMKVSKNNPTEVISMTQVHGTLPPKNEAASNTALIVSDNNQPASVEFLPEDPFLIRGFEDPNNRQGEFYGKADSAVIAVDIPSDLGEAASGAVSLELSKVKRSAEGTIPRATPDAALLLQFKSNKRLERQSRLSGSQIKTAARDSTKTRSIP